MRTCNSPVSLVGSRCLKNTPVQRCEAHVKNFPPLCLFRVHFGSVAELERTKLFSDRAYAMFNVVTVELERLTIGSYSAQCDMHMRVLGIVMGHGYPFNISIEIVRNAPHQFSRKLWQVGAVSKFGRND